MGKPDKKGAELQQQQAGTSKLGLAPLVSKPGKVTSGPANRQQLLGKVGTAAGDVPTKLATVKQLLDQQLKDPNRSLEQQAAKFEKQLEGHEAQRANMAQTHAETANKMLQSATDSLDQAKTSNDQAIQKLNQMSKDASAQMARAQKALMNDVTQLQSQVAKKLEDMKRKAKIKA